MEKTRKCLSNLSILSVIFGVLFVITLIAKPSLEFFLGYYVVDFFAALPLLLFLCFLFFLTLSIVLRCIIEDMSWKLASLELKTENTEHQPTGKAV